MTTLLHPAVAVEPSGFVTACSWCCTREQLETIGRTYPVSHGLCPSCDATLNAEMDAREAACVAQVATS